MEKIKQDHEFSDEELKYHLIRIIGSYDGPRFFELQEVLSRESQLPLKERTNFVAKDDNDEKLLKRKLMKLIETLKANGWVIEDPCQSSGEFFILTPEAKKLFEDGKFEDMKEITEEYVEETGKLLQTNLLKNYLKESFICYKDKRLGLASTFLLGAVSEGVIIDLIDNYNELRTKLNMPQRRWSNSPSNKFEEMMKEYSNQKIYDKIKQRVTLINPEYLKLKEFQNYCTFFFNIYRHSRNDVGHLQDFNPEPEMIKTALYSFKKYVEYINSVKALFNKVK